MTYATIADLIDRFGEEELIQRTDRMGAGVIDTAIAQRALLDASLEIDGYLGVRYQLPLPSLPPLLQRLCCAIARYHLWEDLANERVRQDYEDARRMLEACARGQISLGLPAALPDTARPLLSLAAAKDGPSALFSRPSMEGY